MIDRDRKVACRQCKHIVPNHKWYLLAIPIFGWIAFMVWHIERKHLSKARCKAILNPTDINIVTGKAPTPAFSECEEERKNYRDDAICGTEGKLFEAK